MKNLKKILIWQLFILSMATVIFNSCSNRDDGENNTVTGIRLDVPTLTLAIGEDYTLTATVIPENAIERTVIWTSSNNEKATVANGKVTAIAEGTATITAKAGNKTATCVVTVYDASRLTFTHNASFNISSLYRGVAIQNVDVSTGVSGGTTPYTYNATGLPAGITISLTTGIISGTPRTLSNTGTATITVKDAEQNTASITISYGAVEEVVNYQVYIGDVRVTSANQNDVLGNGKVTYNPATKTLTLNSVSIDYAYLVDPSEVTYAKIYSAQDLIINLEGSSSMVISNFFATFGILCGGNITFTGTGDLYVAAESTAYGYSGTGIAAYGANGVVFNHCGKITINTNGRAIRANNITNTSARSTITTCQ